MTYTLQYIKNVGFLLLILSLDWTVVFAYDLWLLPNKMEFYLIAGALEHKNYMHGWTRDCYCMPQKTVVIYEFPGYLTLFMLYLLFYEALIL